MRHALVFGGTGQIGEPLIARLRGQGWRITALSRREQADEPGLGWLQGGFDAMPPLPARVDAVISCGPLDRFSHWLCDAHVETARIVAFGSTSVHTKRSSTDEAERDVALRLQRAEDRLMTCAQDRGAGATVLRPTLVYGAARDATLSRIAGLAARAGWLPLPRRAAGLRQPVHVDDLAAAAVACLGAPRAIGRGYDLPGGEDVPYREMVRRVLAALQPPARMVELPGPVFDLALRLAQSRGMALGFGDAAVERMRRDLVFDRVPAVSDFGYAARAFVPTARMFPRPD
jgi:nucleoside-diphosphate-sugar epimerase